MRNFININDIDNYQDLVTEAISLKDNLKKNKLFGKHKTLGLIFFNPSLRTRMSTQKAAYMLGMNVICMNFNMKDGN